MKIEKWDELTVPKSMIRRFTVMDQSKIIQIIDALRERVARCEGALLKIAGSEETGGHSGREGKDGRCWCSKCVARWALKGE